MLALSELRTRFRSLSLSTSTAYGPWDNDRVDVLLNDAIFELFKILIDTFDETYYVASVDALTPNANEINLDTLDPNFPYYKLISFDRKVGSLWRPVTIVTPREAWRQYQVVPEVWYMAGNKLKTDGTVTANTYRLLWHYRLPKLVNAGDVCQIPPEFEEMIPIGAAKIAALQARQKDDVVFFENEWEKRKREMMRAAMNRNQAKQMAVLDVEGYSDGNRPQPGIYVVT